VDKGKYGMRVIFSLLTLLFPWKVRRFLLNWFFGYNIHHTARIGYTVLLIKHLEMGPKSCIGHLNVVKGLDALKMDANALIGNLNWITGFPSNEGTHFKHQTNRSPILHIGEHSAITNRHLIDCTNAVTIGKFTTVAGYRSVILTHSIDLKYNRQISRPIGIGNYCFLGTCCTLLWGSYLPDYSALSANSLLNKEFNEHYCLYGGTPAKFINKLDP
jgi:acetyltransferase-like isoleucine patch superfamily enzyme